jgi:hypothetical protein
MYELKTPSSSPSPDIDPECETLFGRAFDNVEFVTGDAKHTLPRLLARIADAHEPLGFILIDADHSREGIQHNIDSILRYTPSAPRYIIMHDSFNPECRRGIKDANWSTSPHVHLVELDFVAGRFLTEEEPDSYKQMWCGFGLAILLPESVAEMSSSMKMRGSCIKQRCSIPPTDRTSGGTLHILNMS